MSLIDLIRELMHFIKTLNSKVNKYLPNKNILLLMKDFITNLRDKIKIF